MKNLFLLFIFSLSLFFFPSCNKEGTIKSIAGDVITVNSANAGDFTVKVETIVFDSCEYLISRPGMLGSMMTHKGNCRFCEERNKNYFSKLYEDIRKLFLHYFKDEGGDNSN